MRWDSSPSPQHGDIRIRKEFLWIPKTINDKTRWLEYAEWEEQFYKGYWFEMEWLNK
jgi:hypothetical protein